jgi:AraC family transcriptional regulator
MNKIPRFLKIPSFVLLFSLALSGQEASDFKPEVREVPAFAYFCLHHKGPIADIQSVIGQLFQTMKDQNLYPMGPMMGIYFTDPDSTKPEEMEWEMGFPVTKQAMVQAPLEKKEWTYTKVVTATYMGPYEDIHRIYDKLLPWMDKNGYVMDGPVMEKYLNNPSQVKPEELKTEIWIPCRKK